MLNLDVERIRAELHAWGYKVVRTPERRWMCYDFTDSAGFTIVRSTELETLEDSWRALTTNTPPCLATKTNGSYPEPSHPAPPAPPEDQLPDETD